MKGMSKVEQMLFSDESNRNLILEECIEQNKEFVFMYKICNYLNGTNMTEKEIDYQLKVYSDAIDRKFDKSSAKLYAMSPSANPLSPSSLISSNNLKAASNCPTLARLLTM